MRSRPANVSLIYRRCSGRTAAPGREDNHSTEPHPLTFCSMSEHLTECVCSRGMLVGDLPDVTARIAEAGGADSPGTIHRPVQQFDSAALQFVDHRIHVVYTERELEPDTRVGSRDGRRRDKRGRFARLQQVDERVTELEDGRVVVFEEDWELKDVAIEALRGREVLDE